MPANPTPVVFKEHHFVTYISGTSENPTPVVFREHDFVTYISGTSENPTPVVFREHHFVINLGYVEHVGWERTRLSRFIGAVKELEELEHYYQITWDIFLIINNIKAN